MSSFFLYQLESSRKKEKLGQERKALMSLRRREDADLTGGSSGTWDRAEGSWWMGEKHTDREGFRGFLMVSSISKGECKTLSAQKIEKRVLRKQAPTLMCGEELGIRHAFSWIEVWQLFRGRDEIMGLRKGSMCLLHSCRAPVKEWMRNCPMEMVVVGSPKLRRCEKVYGRSLLCKLILQIEVFEGFWMDYPVWVEKYLFSQKTRLLTKILVPDTSLNVTTPNCKASSWYCTGEIMAWILWR